MADETYADRLIYGSIHCGGPKRPEYCEVADTGIQPGMPIRVHTDGKAYLTQTSDAIFSGIAEAEAGMSLTDTYAAASTIKYYPKGSGAEVYVKHIGGTAVAVQIGEEVGLGADGSTIHMEDLYTDAAYATDTNALKVGTAKEYIAGHATEKRVLRIVMS